MLIDWIFRDKSRVNEHARLQMKKEANDITKKETDRYIKENFIQIDVYFLILKRSNYYVKTKKFRK